MRIYGQDFEAVVERILAANAADKGLTRSELSRRVCEWLDWRSPNGALRTMSYRKGLLKLEALGEIPLPASCGLPGESSADSSVSDAPFIATQFTGTLAELGHIELVAVEAKSLKSRQWREMLDLYHPLKSGPLCGAQQRYLIRSEKIGWLVVYLSGSPSRKQKGAMPRPGIGRVPVHEEAGSATMGNEQRGLAHQNSV